MGKRSSAGVPRRNGRGGPPIFSAEGGVAASALPRLRTGEAIYRELDLAHVTDRERLLAALIAHPILLERPIIICDDARAVIGRPPERVDELLVPVR